MGHLSSGLAALLDALERDLLAAPVDEVRDALGETGRARNAACQEVRTLLNEAILASENAGENAGISITSSAGAGASSASNQRRVIIGGAFPKR